MFHGVEINDIKYDKLSFLPGMNDLSNHYNLCCLDSSNGRSLTYVVTLFSSVVVMERR